MKRITFLFALISCISSAQSPIVESQLFATGFENPINILNAGDDRLFVLEQAGDIKVVQSDGSVNTNPFLSLEVEIPGEGGLMGLAFHPNYTNNGYLYVYYSTLNNTIRTSRFKVNEENPDVADVDSELVILEIDNQSINHNGGSILFDQNGYLFISTGDDNEAAGILDLTNYNGKLLRIDVDNPSNDNNYGIPADNPYINDANALSEIWAIGLRNPWKVTLDEPTNTLYIADVGQALFEEINKVSADIPGLHYGWPCYEATEENTLIDLCNDNPEITFPVANYPHGGQNGLCSITGGYVYRGTQSTEWQDLYFFADFCSGQIGVMNLSNDIEIFSPDIPWISSFGEDNEGELYVSSYFEGSIYKLNDGTLSTEDITLTRPSLYPNPTSSTVTFKYPAFAKAETLILYDLNGKSVLNQNINSIETTISVGHLAQGIYIARLSSSPQIIKLVVQ